MENIGFNTSNDKIAIVSIASSKRIDLQFVPTISEEFSANYNETVTLGNFLHADFAGTNRTIKLDFTFSAQMEGYNDVLLKIRAIAQHFYVSKQTQTPERVFVVCGEIFEEVPYIITSMTANYDFLHPDTLLPKICRASMTFKAVPTRPQYAQERFT